MAACVPLPAAPGEATVSFLFDRLRGRNFPAGRDRIVIVLARALRLSATPACPIMCSQWTVERCDTHGFRFFR
jgi:hypothetical protein